mgnify:CR=1 FL=1
MVEDEIDTDYKAICNIVLKQQRIDISEKNIEIKSRISKKDYHLKLDKILNKNNRLKKCVLDGLM